MPATRAKPRADKISVSVDHEALKRAKLVAKRTGVSLSHFVSEAMVLLATEAERREAARALVATFPPEAHPTDDEMETFRKEWSTPHRASVKRQRRAR